MNRKDLKAKLVEAGLEEEKVNDLVDYIMQSNGNDINKAKAEAETSLESAKTELESVKKSNTDLQEKLNGFSDYEDLKKFKAESLEKEVKQQRSDFLKSVGCKHPELFIKEIDWEKASYDQDKKVFTGIEDTLKSLKDTYKDMFVTEKGNPNLFNNNIGSKNTVDDPIIAQYKQTHPDVKF